MSDRDAVISRCLDALEDLELPLVSWGVVDAYISSEEALDAATKVITEAGAWGDFSQPDDLLEELESRCLIFSTLAIGQAGYATRFRETLRHLTRLRQLFPKHLSDGGWSSAPRLVADFRVLSRPREYPRRDVPGDELLATVHGDAVQASTRNSLAALLDEFAGGELSLSGFQTRATSRILKALGEREVTGTVVAAGTGSGKTLAFYLPGLSDIAAHIDQSNWVKCLAIYPRTELLKDQFGQVFEVARALGDHLRTSGRRPVRLGALFGATPSSPKWVRKTKGWDRVHEGHRCPFVRCPEASCGTHLVWRTEDMDRSVERLVCPGPGCGFETRPDEVALTRSSIRKSPPDVLFTTTEMLNQRLSDTAYHRLFGIGSAGHRKPRMVLLDEIHTYYGMHGAQVAMLLRRWRHASKARPHFVGLSATLRDAARFFGDLTGVGEYRVRVEEPRSDELVREGREYLVALRGDPVSPASLLATTIQSLMLSGRMLDPRHEFVSHGFYGSRVFAFTDDLDVTNRLYFSVLDAEGWRRPGVRRTGDPLSALRASGGSDTESRRRDGQVWESSEKLGHALADPLTVERTSSQDAGLGTDSDLVVATASLEVGFDDPTVGMVVQHKAPRDDAAFLQRRGRAGRTRGMRPWTVAVLSDFGRDRLAYQGYDALFDPELKPRYLPLQNRFAQKIQAVYAVMDWASRHIDSFGSVWEALCLPNAVSNRELAGVQAQIAALTLGVLESQDLRADLEDYLQRALDISADELAALLWDQPRALVQGVLPTIARRLERQWTKVGTTALEYHRFWSPLPEFVPSTLFSDLNLPEIEIRLPDSDDENGGHLMPVFQGMREFAPGRVSRRFGIDQAGGHWSAPADLESASQTLPVERWSAGELEPLGTHVLFCGELEVTVPCWRPYAIAADAPPTTVNDTSNARLVWGSSVKGLGTGRPLRLPRESPLSDLLADLAVFGHSDGCYATVHRIALGSEVDLSMRDGTRSQLKIDFVGQDGARAGAGFKVEVDALKATCRIPSDLVELVRSDDPLARSLRSQFFADRVRSTGAIDPAVNVFQRDWLALVYRVAVTWKALNEGLSPKEAARIVSASNDSTLLAVLPAVFQVEVGDDGAAESRILAELSELLSLAGVREALAQQAYVLWGDVDASWQDWLSKKFVGTFAAAFLQGIQAACPGINGRDLAVDLRFDCDDPGRADVWISEQSPGGLGLIEQFCRECTIDPLRVMRLVAMASGESDLEIMDREVGEFLRLLPTEESLRRGVDGVRQARGSEAALRAIDELTQAMQESYIAPTHAVVVALNARVLRPGSSHDTDDLMRRLLEEWRELETRLGYELDARVVAYYASGRRELDAALAQFVPVPADDDRAWRYGALYGLLWPRGTVVRSAALSLYSPFEDLPTAESLLLRAAIPGRDVHVELVEGWQVKIADALLVRGRAVLVSQDGDAGAVRSAIHALTSMDIDEGYLMLNARVAGLRLVRGAVHVIVELPERQA